MKIVKDVRLNATYSSASGIGKNSLLIKLNNIKLFNYFPKIIIFGKKLFESQEIDQTSFHEILVTKNTASKNYFLKNNRTFGSKTVQNSKLIKKKNNFARLNKKTTQFSPFKF